ncbi:MAG: exosortase/archaeosortase family protein [Terriglobales bacterium]
MSTLLPPAAPPRVAPTRTLRRLDWLGLAALAVAALALYAPVLARLGAQWWTDETYSYGFLVPLFCAWLVWRRRGRLRTLAPRPARSGWWCVAGALAMLLVGRLGSELLMTRLSLLLMLTGLILVLAGRRWLRALAFPLCFLAFMIPLPVLIYNLATLPLESVATRAGVALVAWTGLPILRQGNLIALPATVLDVVAACSGIRSLLALLALGTAYGYLTEPGLGRRMILVAAMVPLAIVSNAVRIACTILLSFPLGAAASHGAWHQLTGLEVFVIAVVGLVLIQRLLHVRAPGKAASRA